MEATFRAASCACCGTRERQGVNPENRGRTRYRAIMTFPLVRSAHVATNALHSLIYFAPETEQHLTSAGLRPGRMCYFAGRAAPKPAGCPVLPGE